MIATAAVSPKTNFVQKKDCKDKVNKTLSFVYQVRRLGGWGGKGLYHDMDDLGGQLKTDAGRARGARKKGEHNSSCKKQTMHPRGEGRQTNKRQRPSLGMQ